jgi:hypothetical protein
VDGGAGRRLLRRRAAEDIQAEVVSHDARQQTAFTAFSIYGVHGRPIGRVLDGRPRRGPERIDTGLFIEDFRDVAAFLEYGHAEVLVFDRRRAATVVAGH